MANALQFQDFIFLHSILERVPHRVACTINLEPNTYNKAETNFYFAFSSLALQGLAILCLSYL